MVKPIIWGGNMVHAIYHHSNISDLLGDPKNIRGSQWHNIVPGTHYELLIAENMIYSVVLPNLALSALFKGK